MSWDAVGRWDVLRSVWKATDELGRRGTLGHSALGLCGKLQEAGTVWGAGTFYNGCVESYRQAGTSRD
jgi:hypothetical protein